MRHSSDCKQGKNNTYLSPMKPYNEIAVHCFVCVCLLNLHSISAHTRPMSTLIDMVLSSACLRLPHKLTAEQAVGSNTGEQEANQLTFSARMEHLLTAAHSFNVNTRTNTSVM